MISEDKNILGSDQHYLRTVTQMGDQHKIVSHKDIYSENGLKLVAKGTPINSRQFDKLVHHKLLPPLDQCLTVENAVDNSAIQKLAQELLDKNPLVQKLLGTVEHEIDVLAIIGSIILNNSLAFKLTVAREQQPDLLIHSILLCLFVIYLGHKYGLKEKQLIELATAALFHDLGILHINPELLQGDHVLTVEERRHLYTHPMVAYLILVEFPEYPPSVSHAVLEHHERLDGSGYPRGLKANKISLYGMLLAVAEIAASRCDKDGHCHNFHNLEIIFKLNMQKLPRDIIALLAPFYLDREDKQEITRNELPRKLPAVPYSLAELLVAWIELTESPGGFVIQREYQPLFDFLNEQIINLLKELREAGFDPHNLEQLMQDADEDHQYLEDMITLTQEAHWQIQVQIHEAVRRWPELFAKESEGQAAVLGNWINKANELSLSE